jgi:hypothetical protein
VCSSSEVQVVATGGTSLRFPPRRWAIQPATHIPLILLLALFPTPHDFLSSEHSRCLIQELSTCVTLRLPAVWNQPRSNETRRSKSKQCRGEKMWFFIPAPKIGCEDSNTLNTILRAVTITRACTEIAHTSALAPRSAEARPLWPLQACV